MKLIIKISDEMFNTFKKHGIMAFDYFGEYDKDQIAIAIAHGTPYNPSGDAISREALKKKLQARHDNGEEDFDKGYNIGIEAAIELLDNAPPVEPERPQGEYVDISKLRLMTVEECAGHTIEYAMGWKACIEWIKKGGAE